MGASQTKLSPKNTRNLHKLRRHDYRVASTKSRRFGDLEAFPSAEESEYYFSSLSASGPIPIQRGSFGRNNMESSIKPAAKTKTQSANETTNEPQKRTTRTNPNFTTNVQSAPKPVTRHHSAILAKSPNKATHAGSKTDEQHPPKYPSSPVSSQRKSRSNGQTADALEGCHKDDSAFASSIYALTDSSRIMGNRAGESVTRSATFLGQTENRKLVAKSRDDLSNYSQDLPTGDTQEDTNLRSSPKENKSVRRELTSRLSDKPPTPPPKTNLTKSSTVVMQNSNLVAQSHYANSKVVSPTKTKQTYQAPVMKQNGSSVRCNSAARSPTMKDYVISTPQSYSVPSSPAKTRRSGSQKSDTEVERREKPACLSRIEYTFYINDTDAYQRPFYDRRVEAIARASQCNICLHKPPPGQKPIYYKGNRVLPVTISARTMVTLKRCMARLDMQYPYFNVKAFCPPDMY
ncbi:hypothetical protein FGIG_04125 [Fasciola gigantica]|uniref:Uncharacterized protein n=1 Tax=Fasciola gigantica TaxID=46835 RepID=A0A504YUN8_FASGI|nr:hypothetical protein FGIG_04125 [Fasciola gigantica]